MKKPVKWTVVVLIISGWATFGIYYASAVHDRARMQAKITELESELDSYQFMAGDIYKSTREIEEIIATLENLKINLNKLQDKMEKGAEKNESS